MRSLKIAIVGAGSMGRGICQLFATAGYEVTLIDLSSDVLNDARDFILSKLNRQVEKGRITDVDAQAIFGRIYISQNLDICAGKDLVIEAIIENLEVKQDLFRRLDDMVEEHCILATNTSSLSVSAIASACKMPNRVIGIHFFNPAPIMKLVEIIPAVQTEERIVNQAIQLINLVGKLPVRAKDTPGFIVNRIARPFYGEALRILEEGIASVSTIDWAVKEFGGFRMGPFELMDYIGNDINYAVTESVFNAFYYDERYKPSFTQKRLTEAGYLGRKVGKGYYNYQDGAVVPTPNNDPDLAKSIFNRILCMLINEAADALFWGIASADDIETAMTKGVNYPKGLLQWANEFGIDNCVKVMDQLFHVYREPRYRCSPLLRAKSESGSTFFRLII